MLTRITEHLKKLGRVFNVHEEAELLNVSVEALYRAMYNNHPTTHGFVPVNTLIAGNGLCDEYEYRLLSGGMQWLTTRQIEVLHLVAQGLTNKQIARQLGIDPETVNTHVKALLATSNISSRSMLWVLLDDSSIKQLRDYYT